MYKGSEGNYSGVFGDWGAGLIANIQPSAIPDYPVVDSMRHPADVRPLGVEWREIPPSRPGRAARVVLAFETGPPPDEIPRILDYRIWGEEPLFREGPNAA